MDKNYFHDNYNTSIVTQLINYNYICSLLSRFLILLTTETPRPYSASSITGQRVSFPATDSPHRHTTHACNTLRSQQKPWDLPSKHSMCKRNATFRLFTFTIAFVVQSWQGAMSQSTIRPFAPTPQLPSFRYRHCKGTPLEMSKCRNEMLLTCQFVCVGLFI